MGRLFIGLLALGVTASLSACGSDKREGASVEPLTGTGGSSSEDAGIMPDEALGGSGFVDDDDPQAGGSAGCEGASCLGDAGLVPTLCANGELDDGEQCDDGNNESGDGCNGVCNREPNFACEEAGEACSSTIVCGDGAVGGTEACDDGNPDDGDGCSSECRVEEGFGCVTVDGASVCTSQPVAVCGDGVVGAGEQCDDGDAVGADGCSETCQVEPGFVCRTSDADCEPIEFCGDGFLRAGVEQCDDGDQSPGDGCNGACRLEPNFVCQTPGQPCRSTRVCGDSLIVPGETCDDGNTLAGDGCSSTCFAEPGFNCRQGGLEPVPGPCVRDPEERCGDQIIAATESCEDGNLLPGDGCSATCEIEIGFNCPRVPEQPCVQVERCGDGVVTTRIGEQCDDGPEDGDPVGGDGCSANCRREALFTCPELGGPCVSDVDCGDGLVNGPETCDDRNARAGDGCDDCQLEPGFVCPVGGVCRSICGDGIRVGLEQCDDGDTAGGDGCGPTCRLEEGFRCDDPAGATSDPEDPDVCSPTLCGQRGREGTEQCDDGNGLPYDGCFECRNEPCRNSGSGFECGAVCGDGMKFPIEACDDGNTSSGDGCSASCALEPGFECFDEQAELGDVIELPAVLRDFNGAPAIGTAPRHPQFQINPVNGIRLPGIVLGDLGANGKPVYNPAYSCPPGHPSCVAPRPWTMDGPSNGIASGTATLNLAQIAARFQEWYTDVPGTNVTFVQFLPLTRQADDSFQFRDNEFFPLTGLGFGDFQDRGQNFHFTSEVRQAFVFDPDAPAPTLTFRGDDDVWVFVNGQLTVDLGGIHSELTGRIVIDGADSQLCVAETPGTDVVDFDANPAAFCTTTELALDPEDVNEIAVFQAERNITQSNYTLTLRGFEAPITTCNSVCGDGVVTADEACDLGAEGNTGEYETCNLDCTLTARCGDGRVDAGEEQCDNGINTSTRLLVAGDCAPGCRLPPSCGDGALDGAFELCDEGADNAALVNGQVPYDRCGTNCALGPFCGDGVQQVAAGEQCDTGPNNGSDGSPCQSDCQLRCGNGVTDPGEECDDGSASNVGGYDRCQADCRRGPRCGDAVVDAVGNEQCDDGLNDGSYGTCAPGCVPGPICGDGVTQGQFGELCDEGSANISPRYGDERCTIQCRPAPFCGDQAVNIEFGETCDDGVNDGSPGSCTPDCSDDVPLPLCNDGRVDAGEACDNGANNGTPGNACDVRCQLACGNGFVDEGEDCDDGVNSGDYGTCNPDCTSAGSCGDGVVQRPAEICDAGSENVGAGAYGDGLCTEACQPAPRCGDRRVDAGEACDGSPGCSASCTFIR